MGKTPQNKLALLDITDVQATQLVRHEHSVCISTEMIIRLLLLCCQEPEMITSCLLHVHWQPGIGGSPSDLVNSIAHPNTRNLDACIRNENPTTLEQHTSDANEALQRV